MGYETPMQALGPYFSCEKYARIAFFADVTVKLWINFPAGDTAKDERRGHDTQKNTRPRSDQTN